MQLKGRIVRGIFEPERRDLWENTLANWDGKEVEIEIHLKEYARTLQQNKALHKYLELLSDALNAAGKDMRATIKPEVLIPWSKHTMKEYVWKPLMKELTGKTSTRDMTKEEVNKVYLVMDKAISERTGVTIPFPSNEE